MNFFPSYYNPVYFDPKHEINNWKKIDMNKAKKTAKICKILAAVFGVLFGISVIILLVNFVSINNSSHEPFSSGILRVYLSVFGTILFGIAFLLTTIYAFYDKTAQRQNDYIDRMRKQYGLDDNNSVCEYCGSEIGARQTKCENCGAKRKKKE